MFFPERIKSIKHGDRVLEIGPGGTPHPRSDVFLEKIFTPAEAEGQRGYAPPLQDRRDVVFYEGRNFPFNNDEFDYVICSHVLEHVDDVDGFVAEITRIAKKGYIEFPTVYYDFIYNFPEHITLLLHKNNVVHWMPKEESGLNEFNPINTLFYESLKAGYVDYIDQLKVYFFQGFEWSEKITTQRVSDLQVLSFTVSELEFSSKMSVKSMIKSFASTIKRNTRL